MKTHLYNMILCAVSLSCAVGCGLPRAPVDGTVNNPAGSHPGIDFSAPTGQPIGAICRGHVVYAAGGWNRGCGNMVSIVHENGYQGDYCHLSGLAVSTGQDVGTGQLLGWVGSTGNATGPHLHFQFFHNGALLVNDLNAAFPLGQHFTLGQAWGGGLNPALSCP